MTNIDEMQVKAGEAVARTTQIVSDTEVRMFNVSKNDTTGNSYKVNWLFDFGNCTDHDILLLAARSAVIAYRKNFRKVSESSIPNFADIVIDVKEDVLNVERKGKTNEEKAVDLMSKMSPEDIQKALIAAGIELPEQE